MERRQLLFPAHPVFRRWALLSAFHSAELTLSPPVGLIRHPRAELTQRRDFQIPQSLVFQLANAATPIFFKSYSLDGLPQLNGAVSYITTSAVLDDVGPSRSVAFRNVVDRFRVYGPPVRPIAKEELWQGGRRVEGRGERC